MPADLLIVCATEPEVASFLDQCTDLDQTISQTRRKIISGKINQTDFDLLITGAGVFNTVQALTAHIETRPHLSRPVLILQTGISGVFKESELSIGDVALAISERYIHTGVGTDTVQHLPLPFELVPGDPDTAQGVYRFDIKRVNQWLEYLKTVSSLDDVKLISDPFITVSTITGSVKTASDLHAAYGPVMEAMEGAASAHLARLYEIPMLEIRAASNFTGDRDKSNWQIKTAAKNLARVLTCLSETGFFLDRS